MAILYSLVINNPHRSNRSSGVGNWPPQIIESSWATSFKNLTFELVRLDNVTVLRLAYFNTVADFEAWANATRISDPALIAALDEWKTTYGITYTEEYYEIPTYTPGVSGILG